MGPGLIIVLAFSMTGDCLHHLDMARIALLVAAFWSHGDESRPRRIV